MADIVTQLNEILAAIKTRLATELGATEAEILINSLNFESTAPLKISLTYDIVSEVDSGVTEKGRPYYTVSSSQIALFRYILPINDADGAEAERKAAIDEVALLSRYCAQEIDLYRSDLYRKPVLARIATDTDYSTGITKTYGWDNQGSSEGRYRICLLDFFLVAQANCFD